MYSCDGKADFLAAITSVYEEIQVHLNKLECRGKVNLFQ